MYKIETERGDLFDVNMMIAMQVNVRGYATETELTEAFRADVGAFEILNCKVVIDDKGSAFYDNCKAPMNSIVFRDFELEELIQEQERIWQPITGCLSSYIQLLSEALSFFCLSAIST